MSITKTYTGRRVLAGARVVVLERGLVADVPVERVRELRPLDPGPFDWGCNRPAVPCDRLAVAIMHDATGLASFPPELVHRFCHAYVEGWSDTWSFSAEAVEHFVAKMLIELEESGEQRVESGEPEKKITRGYVVRALQATADALERAGLNLRRKRD